MTLQASPEPSQTDISSDQQFFHANTEDLPYLISPPNSCPSRERTVDQHISSNSSMTAGGGNMVKLRLKSLPSSTSEEVITCYIETLGEDVEVLSLDLNLDGEATASVSGLTEDEIEVLKHKKHKIQKKIFFVEAMNAHLQPSVIEVSGFSENISGDMVKYYFAKKCGVSEDAILSCSVVKPGIAHVMISDASALSQVLSKGQHLAYGSKFEVKKLELPEEKDESVIGKYDLNKLKVGFAKPIPEKHLSLFIKTQLKNSSFDLQFAGSTVIITFNSALGVNELQEMCVKIQDNKIRGVQLTAELVEVCSRILVCNIEEDDYDKDFISLYFNAECGESGVKEVNLIGDGKAIVTFMDINGLECILEKPHSSLGSNVTVQKYGNDLSSGACEISASKHPSTQDFVPQQLEICTGEDLDPVIFKCIKKDLEHFSQELSNLGLIISSKPDAIIVKSSNPATAEWKESSKKLVIDYIHSNFVVLPNIKIPQLSIPEITECVLGFQDKVPIHFFFSEKSTLLCLAGRREIVNELNSSLTIIKNKFIKTKLMLALTQSEYEYVTQVHLESLKDEFLDVTIQLDVKSHGLQLEGSIHDTNELKTCLEDLKLHSLVELSLQAPILQYFISKGRLKFEDFYKKRKKTPCGVYYYQDEKGTTKIKLLCKSTDIFTIRRSVINLSEKTSTTTVPFSESFLLVKKELSDFKPTCESLESSKSVLIIPNEESIIIAGFQQDVQYCADILTAFITEKGKIKTSMKLEKGSWKLLNNFMKEEWIAAVTGCKSLNVDINTTDIDPDHPLITLFGERIKVKPALDNLKKLLSGIERSITSIDRPGTIDFFNSDKSRLYLDGIESRVSVAIEIISSSDEDSVELDLRREDDSNMRGCTKKWVTSIDHIKVTVCIGDITEFEADVIVNAANECLSHDGGVANALSVKGGPIIQNECTRHVRQSGNVDTGEVWLSAVTGKLPCKALIHAVGPKWNGGGKKSETLLFRACIKSLQEAKKYHSIVFPAISTGIYGFPIDICATKMIEAVCKFAKDYPTSKSSLREVTFIFRPADSQNCMKFVSLLDKKFPTDMSYISGADSGTESQQRNLSAEPLKHEERKSVLSGLDPSIFKKVHLLPGSLVDYKAEVYVNSTNPQLDLSQGAVALALLKIGGSSLQQQCDKVAPVTMGDVAITGPGNLQCRYVLHIVLSTYKGTSESEKLLGKAIRKCLKICNDKKVKSVAFPSIGTGNLKFPNDVVAKVMLEEIFKYLSHNKKTSIMDVHVVIYMQDTIDCFQRKLKEFNSLGALPKTVEGKKKRGSIQTRDGKSLLSHTASNSSQFPFNGGVTVSISVGDVTESTCDIIVNPTDSKITFTGQGVAGAILNKGGNELKQLCHTLTSNGKILDDSTIVISTKATGSLKSKRIFHICFEGGDSKLFHKIIASCLEKADDEKYRSIAFPAIGTGVHRYPEEEASVQMFKAIKLFSSKPPKHLKTVNIVLFQRRVFEIFDQAFKNPTPEEGIIQRAKNYFASKLGYAESESAGPSQTKQDKLDIAVYGKTSGSVKKAEQLIYNFMDEIFTTEIIPNPLIDILSDEDESSLRRSCQLENVHLDIDRDPINEIQLKGIVEKVQDMKCLILQKLSNIDQQASILREAKQFSRTVHWKRMDSQESESEYDDVLNYEIEKKYTQDPGGKYEYECPDSDCHFVIDFKKMTENDFNDDNKVYAVVREDIVENFMKGDTPSTWCDMPKDTSVHVEDLVPGDKEYTDVLKEFNKTMPQSNPIKKIQRIQNPALYAQYLAKKKTMGECNSSGVSNESRLFHGTAAVNCPKINQQGFNRSFAGRNAVVYGSGVYFARDASYSARDTYSPPDAQGYKCVYYARVITGEYTIGSQGLIVPPSIPQNPSISSIPQNPSILYDCVVDTIQNPNIYVTFFDYCNYPEYLITFN